MWGGCETAHMTARAMSSGRSASIFGGESKNGVSTMPGSISVTRTPVSLKSWRADSPMPVTAHFVARVERALAARAGRRRDPVSRRWPVESISAGLVARIV